MQQHTHRGLRFDHMIRPLAAAAVFHGIPRFLIEDDAEEENKGTLEVDNRREKVVRTKDNKPFKLFQGELEDSPAHS